MKLKDLKGKRLNKKKTNKEYPDMAGNMIYWQGYNQALSEIKASELRVDEDKLLSVIKDFRTIAPKYRTDKKMVEHISSFAKEWLTLKGE